MSEGTPFSKWESEIFGDIVPKSLPTKPLKNENIIDFAKRLQLIVGSYPDIDQYLVANDALDILQKNVGYEILGRKLFVHALRGFIFSEDSSGIAAGLFNQPFHATGFLEPFSIATLPTESSISIQLKYPTLLSDDNSPMAELETALPLTVPVLGIQDHAID